MSGLTWLHISDWHQKDNDWDRRVVRKALMDDIEGRRAISPDLDEIDFIVFSGDIANSGKTTEYDQAIEYFFKPLSKATQLGEKFRERLFIVPGNHDLDRQMLEGIPAEILDCLKTREGANSCLVNKEKRRWLLSPFTNYSQFVQKYLRVDSKESALEPEYLQVRSIEKDGKVIAFAGLNSAWMCGRNKDSAGRANDYGNLILGEPPIKTAIRQIRNADIRIAAMHHPFTWLTDFDRDLIEENLHRTCHFVLHGHQHLPRVHVIASTIGDTISIPAGTIYGHRFVSNPRYNNSYNFVHVDFENLRGTVYLRRWDDQQGWVEDTGGKQRKGRFPFVLPKSVDEHKDEVYYGQVAQLVGQLSQRFCDRHTVSLKQRVEVHNGVTVVRQEVRQQLEIVAGPEEKYEIDIKLSVNNQTADPAQTPGGNLKPDEVDFRVNGRPLAPHRIKRNKVTYQVHLDKDTATIDFSYFQYVNVADFFMLSLNKFTRTFKLSIKKDNKLDYEIIRLGNIPTTHSHDLISNREEIASTGLCRSEQGYIIRWYPKAVSSVPAP